MLRKELAKLNTLLYLFGEEYTGEGKAFPHNTMAVKEARNLVNAMILRMDRSDGKSNIN